MSANERIGLYYSPGPHFGAVLGALREHWPEAHLVALVPKDFPDDETLHSADAVLRIVPEQARLTRPRRLLGLAQALRQQQFDRFIVLFPSGRLRLLAGVSGAAHCEAWLHNHRLIALEQGLFRSAIAVSNSWIGRRLYWTALWLRAHGWPVRPAKPKSSEPRR